MLNYTITEEKDTRDNSDLWVMRITDRLSTEAYQATATALKKIGGCYSRFKKGFIFKSEPATSDIENILSGNVNIEMTVKSEIENVHGVKVGDIFYTSWGYEQTNIDFFEVVAVTAKMATIKPIKQKRKETHYMQGNCEPDKGNFITDSSFYKKEYKTRTASWGSSTEPYLKNADGRDHMGHYYTGGSIGYSEYA